MNGLVSYHNKAVLESRVLFDNEAQELVLLRRRLPSSPDAVVDCDTVGALLMARDVGELIEAADALGPLGDGTRGIDREAVAARVDGGRPRFTAPTTAQLLAPYFDPGAGLGGEDGRGNPLFVPQGRPRKAAAERCAGTRGWAGRGFLADDAVLTVERVQDWEFLRNLFSVTMRFVAKGAGGADAAGPLTAAGFALETWPLGPDETFDAQKVRFSVPVGAFLGWPEDKGMWPSSARWADVLQRAVRGDGVPSEDELGIGCREGDPYRYLYAELRMRPGGYAATEPRAANLILNCMEKVFGATRSIDLAAGERGGELRGVADPNSLGEAMWELLRDHPGQRILMCERCGRVRYTRLGGRDARWCCDSCRVLSSKG